jgi:gamma-glutamylcyclotransferase (GGCT)/AIG2-like uncharacterized protein YtfP
MNRLPFFVYGTLLPGQPNYRLWQNGLLAKHPATFKQGYLLDLVHFPMLVEGDNDMVKGMLMIPHPHAYTGIMNRLDELEDFDPSQPTVGAYYRAERLVHLSNNETCSAWVYLGRPKYAGDAPVIESGDWIAHSAAVQNEIKAFWASEIPFYKNHR